MLRENVIVAVFGALLFAVTGYAQDTSIRPFPVHFSDEALADLKRRIAATRWPERETVADQSQGVQLATVQKLARSWAMDYDWRNFSRTRGNPSFPERGVGL